MTKQQILEALSRWIKQRPGLEFGNYGEMKSYRSELRQISEDKRDAEALLTAVALRDSITAQDLLNATRAYSGRLQIVDLEKLGKQSAHGVRIEYCTGQYWPTEYRKAVCAVLASALWERKRADMPAPSGFRVESWTRLGNGRAYHTIMQDRKAAEIQLKDLGGQQYGHVTEVYGNESAGDWMRSSFRREFGKSIANRWFN